MVSTMQEKEEEGRLLEIFQAFDSDKDGQLSKEELIEGYTQLFGDSLLAVVEVDRIIEQVDISHNGLIDYSGIFYFYTYIFYRVFNGKCFN